MKMAIAIIATISKTRSTTQMITATVAVSIPLILSGVPPTEIDLFVLYHCLVKVCPWAEHLTSLPKGRGVCTLSSVYMLNYERVPMLYVYNDSLYSVTLLELNIR